MKYFANIDWDSPKQFPGATGYPIFEEGTAPCKGCTAGLNHFNSEEYPEMLGVHEDNEGFYVISGSGMAKIGEEETVVKEGSFFYAPAGVPHGVKKDNTCEYMEVVLFHFPVTE